MTTLEIVKKCMYDIPNAPKEIKDTDQWVTDLAFDSLDWAMFVTNVCTLLPIDAEKLDAFVMEKRKKSHIATNLFLLTPKQLAEVIDEMLV